MKAYRIYKDGEFFSVVHLTRDFVADNNLELTRYGWVQNRTVASGLRSTAAARAAAVLALGFHAKEV